MRIRKAYLKKSCWIIIKKEEKQLQKNLEKTQKFLASLHLGR